MQSKPEIKATNDKIFLTRNTRKRHLWYSHHVPAIHDTHAHIHTHATPRATCCTHVKHTCITIITNTVCLKQSTCLYSHADTHFRTETLKTWTPEENSTAAQTREHSRGRRWMAKAKQWGFRLHTAPRTRTVTKTLLHKTSNFNPTLAFV